MLYNKIILVFLSSFICEFYFSGQNGRKKKERQEIYIKTTQSHHNLFRFHFNKILKLHFLLFSLLSKLYEWIYIYMLYFCGPFYKYIPIFGNFKDIPLLLFLYSEMSELNSVLCLPVSQVFVWDTGISQMRLNHTKFTFSFFVHRILYSI